MSDSRASVRTGAERLGQAHPRPPAAAGHSREPKRIRVVGGRGRAPRTAAKYLTALFGAGIVVLAGGTVAHAGGTPVAECPSGTGFELSPLGAEPDPGPPPQIEGGFYAQTGSFWPPPTAILCRTEPSSEEQPVLVLGEAGCADEAVALRVPDLTPPDYLSPGAAEWGTYLPPGWYVLGSPETGTAAGDAPAGVPVSAAVDSPGFSGMAVTLAATGHATASATSRVTAADLVTVDLFADVSFGVAVEVSVTPAGPVPTEPVPTDLLPTGPLPPGTVPAESLPDALAAVLPENVVPVEPADPADPDHLWTGVCWYPAQP